MVTSLLAAFMCVPAAAQPALDDPQSRPVSRAQGETVVQAAWELRKGLDPKPDCSHFVHAVYHQAGLDYEYANSSAIFAGVPEFQRVQKPQPGDLIVWPGHVGIVVDPGEHSFYSSVVKGFALEDYRSRYWTHHGQPRFYRYLIDQAQSARLRVQAEPSPRAAKSGQGFGRAPREISDVPPDEASGDDRGFSEERVSVKTSAIATADQTAAADVIESILVSSRSRPLKTEVRAALVRAAAANGERTLRASLQGSQAVNVGDEFTVMEMNIQGHSGWAVIEVVSTASIQNGKAHLLRQSAKWRLTLRREAQGWVILVPRETNCMARDQAIQVLTARVSQLSHDPENQVELKRTVRLLNDLLTGDKGYVPGAASD